MFTALLSFLGGSAFRMLWGEISHWITEREQHKQELDRMRLQAELDAAQHTRQMESMRMQADMGIKVIEAQSAAVIGGLEAEGWLEAVKATGRSVGIAWVDAWNASIRPAVASWSVLMLSLDAAKVIVLTEFTTSVCSAALGIYLASRDLAKRGK